MKFGSITTGIVSDGLVFNVDAANRASYPVQRTLATAESGSCYNTLDLTQSGSFIGDPQFLTQPVSASCWAFDGVDDYINSSDDIGVNGLTGASCFCWVKSDTIAVNKAIAVKWDYETQGCFGFQTDNSTVGELRVFIADAADDEGDNHTYTSDASLTSNTWYFVGFVYDGSQSNANRVKIYVDGVAKSTTTNNTIATSLFAATSTFKIGLFGGDIDRFWNGKIANCQIYNKALTASEVLHNYNALKSRFT